MLLRSASRRLTAVYDAALAPAGVTVAQFSLLRRLDRERPPSLTEIARAAELDRSTVGRNVRVLVRQGLAEFAGGTDQREASVRLTEAGRTALARCLPLWDDVQRRVGDALGTSAAELHARLGEL